MYLGGTKTCLQSLSTAFGKRAGARSRSSALGPAGSSHFQVVTTKRAGKAKVMAGIIAKQCHSGQQRHAHHLIMQSFRSCLISHFRHTQHPPLAPESQA
jgi:hypothetical protein